MATTAASGGECSIAVSTESADANGGVSVRVPRREVRRRRRVPWREVRRRERSEEQRSRAMSAVKAEGKLNKMVFHVAFMEWAGNAVGTLASLWATIVLLGGFCSVLSPTDFWFSTVMIFIEATRIFIRNDASVNQWLFGSTRAFRWTDFSSTQMLVQPKTRNQIAVIFGACISLVPVFRPEIVVGILKVALLVIFSQLLTRLRAEIVLIVFVVAAGCVGGYVSLRLPPAAQRLYSPSFKHKFWTLLGIWVAVIVFGQLVAALVKPRIFARLPHLTEPKAQLKFKIFIALGLVYLPFLQRRLASRYTYVSMAAAVLLQSLLSNPETSEQDDSPSNGQILIDTVLPILFFWSVMFPLPGISQKMSLCILLPVLAAVLIGNLQVPVAVLQCVLSIMRLRNLLGLHRHDYRTLPEGASPNFVPSIVVFFMLELFQGLSYMVATIVGLIYLSSRRSLARDLGFTGKWGAKAIDLYYHQAFQIRMEKGLFPSEKYTNSLDNFAIESIVGKSTSREMQIAGLHVLNNCLERGDSTSNNKLVAEIAIDDTNIITRIIGLINYLVEEEKSGDAKNVASLCLYFVVKRITMDGGEMGTRFHHKLSENPSFLNSLRRILDLEDCETELWEEVMDVIAHLALDEATRQEIGRTHAIIGKLMHAFLRPYDDVNPSRWNTDYLQMAAGEALANLTIMSPENCWAILLEDDQEHNLVKNITKMLGDEYCIRFAANLLHNLCANSRDMLIDLGANNDLESALTKVMEIVMTKEGKQLEVALSVASQIGYVIPEYFAQVLDEESDMEATTLVRKLVDTLNSNKEPSLEYPRMRRVLVEMVISIVDLCPRYISIFIENGLKDALDMVKGTPSRFDKYRVFLGDKGVVTESLPMRDLVKEAKRLIHQEEAPSSVGDHSDDHA